MKKRLIFVGALLLAGTVTTSLCMKNAAATTDLLAANIEAISAGEYPGWECAGMVANAILDKDPGTTTETVVCQQTGQLKFSRGVLFDGRYLEGMTYTIGYETSSCQRYNLGSCCDPSQAGYHIINDGFR
ncbi:hypothetical protein GHJ49_07710 [Alistipes sp. dk3620]|mgnify:CR=1 FL=1|uniref:hypothetical protein n=1 Tax=unclassified Alistipes TaxID=2608932 RepID=UPI001294F9C7|nr:MULTISPECIES: hypothetical protein [unclassified Alistipes]MDO5385308.1 hypothetical protein [Rikenellaceae bacterium]MQX27528.1 hypothetical protein [Alistipes sp. dk3620]QGA22584.1 hypothetical protein GFH31_01285 [Alistipes sp. dk3624]